MRVKFKENVSGSFSTGKVQKFTKGNEYPVSRELLDMMIKTIGRKDFYVEVAESSILKKPSKQPANKKDLSTINKVDKAKITKRATKK
jgi:hypothetical protein